MNRIVMKGIWFESMVVYIFTLHLQACDNTKLDSDCPWYGLRMSFKVPWP